MFHRTECDIKRANDFLRGTSLDRRRLVAIVADVAWIASAAGVAKVAGSIHINSTMLCLCLFLFLFLTFFFPSFSYFHVFLFQPIILVYFRFAYFIFAKNAVRMNSMHSIRKMFHRTEGDIKRASDFLNCISVGRL
jgi:hypothetical protein